MIKDPVCYCPNNDPYPLCVGNEDVLYFKERCIHCCLYENMDETEFRLEEYFVTLALPKN